MKVLLTGGGSGGHITPLLAVAQKLKQLDPTVQIFYVGERHSKFASMTNGREGQRLFDQRYAIFAGKFRRYHGQSWLARLMDVKTLFYNSRDLVFVALGIIQSWWLLRRLKPDVILMKGGYVGVPVGLAASRRIPLITHDSDAMPGLANRLVSGRAVFHATALPASQYPGYQVSKTRQVGVIVSADYQLMTPQL
ncbi:MAG: glycosyltransferase, partial [Candidatus Saccharimonadales bacterium]